VIGLSRDSAQPLGSGNCVAASGAAGFAEAPPRLCRRTSFLFRSATREGAFSIKVLLHEQVYFSAPIPVGVQGPYEILTDVRRVWRDKISEKLLIHLGV